MLNEPALHWDVFCRVIDNFGDVGVCWRLCSDAAARGHTVRLWLDDMQALTWMAPQPWPQGLSVHTWAEADSDFAAPPSTPPDAPACARLVIEAFGCELPTGVQAQMRASTQAPCWINLEYLSAESYVERSHLLPSPQFKGPAAGLVKHFFYPGFTTRTGGLLREPGLIEAQARFKRDAWLAQKGWARRHEQERVVVLFAYDTPRLHELMTALGEQDTLLLSCPGAGQRRLIQDTALQQAASYSPTPSRVRHIALPYLSQTEFDHLLWSSDLNFVRGEDSFVRAQWAGAPFVWQIYEQDDQAHSTKLDAFMDMWLQANWGPGPDESAQWRTFWRRWNHLDSGKGLDLPDLTLARSHAQRWRQQLLGMDDLCSNLIRFALIHLPKR